MTIELEPIYEPGDKYSFMYEEINGQKVGQIALEGSGDEQN